MKEIQATDLCFILAADQFMLDSVNLVDVFCVGTAHPILRHILSSIPFFILFDFLFLRQGVSPVEVALVLTSQPKG